MKTLLLILLALFSSTTGAVAQTSPVIGADEAEENRDSTFTVAEWMGGELTIGVVQEDGSVVEKRFPSSTRLRARYVTTTHEDDSDVEVWRVHEYQDEDDEWYEVDGTTLMLTKSYVRTTPDPESLPQRYTARRGDTWESVAEAHDLDVDDLRHWNKGTRGFPLKPGTRLWLGDSHGVGLWVNVVTDPAENLSIREQVQYWGPYLGLTDEDEIELVLADLHKHIVSREPHKRGNLESFPDRPLIANFMTYGGVDNTRLVVEGMTAFDWPTNRTHRLRAQIWDPFYTRDRTLRITVARPDTCGNGVGFVEKLTTTAAFQVTTRGPREERPEKEGEEEEKGEYRFTDNGVVWGMARGNFAKHAKPTYDFVVGGEYVPWFLPDLAPVVRIEQGWLDTHYGGDYRLGVRAKLLDEPLLLFVEVGGWYAMAKQPYRILTPVTPYRIDWEEHTVAFDGYGPYARTIIWSRQLSTGADYVYRAGKHLRGEYSAQITAEPSRLYFHVAESRTRQNARSRQLPDGDSLAVFDLTRGIPGIDSLFFGNGRLRFPASKYRAREVRAGFEPVEHLTVYGSHADEKFTSDIFAFHQWAWGGGFIHATAFGLGAPLGVHDGLRTFGSAQWFRGNANNPLTQQRARVKFTRITAGLTYSW